MNSVDFSSLCRVCLQEGATYSIFDEASIHSQLNKVFMEKIEDLEGYPRRICSSCKITLDLLSEFIDKYKKSCEILRESLVKIKTEVDISFDDNNHDFINDDDDSLWDNQEQVEIKIENNNENINCASDKLEKLKLPGLAITRVKSKKCPEESITAAKKTRSSKRKCTQRSSQGSQNIIIETGHHQDQLNTRHTINVIVNNNKKERQKRYREQNRDKLKQREAERRKRIQYSQSIAGPSTSSNTNRIELNNEEIITAQSSFSLEETQLLSIQRNGGVK